MTDEKPTTRLICPLTSPTVEVMRADMESAASLGADTVELRLDFLHHAPTTDELRSLLADPPVDTIVTCRPKREGGHFEGEEPSRLKILHEAAKFKPTFIDVELSVRRADWPAAEIILSHHDFKGVPDNLDEILAQMDASDAAVTKKVAFSASSPEEALLALDALRGSGKPAFALAMGEAGVISRILAKKFGAFGTFAALREGAESAPGQPTIEQLHDLYRWEAIGAETGVYGVIGCPVAHSMSPAIHNAAFAATEL
ncbi:MAG: type I 3-dehydroquinate dehydratase, partial [Planctomycetota bacterium]